MLEKNITTVCIIEDEEDVLSLLRHQCEEAGYCTVCETDGAKGLRLITELQPDIVLLDLMLPGMHGLDVCYALKRNRRTQAIPIIILTACGEERDVVRGLETGACDYIIKPFRCHELLARLRRQVGHHRNYNLLRRRHAQLQSQNQELGRHLTQAARLAEIGAMAAGLQHEIANIFGGLDAGVGVLRQIAPVLNDITQRSDIALNRQTRQQLAVLQTVVDVLREDTDRLRELSAIICNLSRPGSVLAPAAPAEVMAAIKRALRLVRAKGRNLVTCEIKLPPGFLFRMPQIALEQILVNLLTNAVDAVLERRQTKISGYTPKILVWGQSHDDYSVLGVTDNGCGMSAEIQEKLFKEIFTTKPAEKGTGLGLTIVKRLVEESGGNIRFYSSPNQGTTFAITLPHAPAPDRSAPLVGRDDHLHTRCL